MSELDAAIEQIRQTINTGNDWEVAEVARQLMTQEDLLLALRLLRQLTEHIGEEFINEGEEPAGYLEAVALLKEHGGNQ